MGNASPRKAGGGGGGGGLLGTETDLVVRLMQVQENCIDLVGRIADRGAEYVPAREWMRICFELLEMLKAHKKGIRRATVNTFGYIAKAIGPQVSFMIPSFRQSSPTRCLTHVCLGSSGMVLHVILKGLGWGEAASAVASPKMLMSQS